MADHDFYITTPRLVITYFDPANEAHIAFNLDLYKDYTTIDENGNVKRTIPDRAAAIDMMETRVAQIKSTGYGRYLVSVLPPPSGKNEHILDRVRGATPVGLVSLNTRGPDALPLPDVGFNLLPSSRGRGYATEAVDGLLGWYERERGVTEVLGYCDDDNEASMKVLKRAGFELLGERYISGLMNYGGIKVAQPEKSLVWTRGLKKDPKEYGL